MKHVGGESHSRRFFRVSFSKCETQAEDTSLPGRVLGAHDGGIPYKEGVVGEGGGRASGGGGLFDGFEVGHESKLGC